MLDYPSSIRFDSPSGETAVDLKLPARITTGKKPIYALPESRSLIASCNNNRSESSSAIW